MEKWKILVIFLLLGGLAGYGAFQSQSARGPQPLPTPPAGPTPIPSPISSLQGQPAPAWNIPAQNWINTKKPITLQQLKGNVVLLEFFRIECSHCQESVPFIKYLNKTYGPQGLKIVAIQSPGTAPTENNWKTVQGRLQEWGVEYPVAFDAGAALFKNKYQGTTYPSLLLIDRNGVIRMVQTGHDMAKARMLEDAIKAALKP